MTWILLAFLAGTQVGVLFMALLAAAGKEPPKPKPSRLISDPGGPL